MQTATQGSKSEIGAFFMASFLSLLAGNAITSYGLIVLSHALSGSNVFAGSVFLVNGGRLHHGLRVEPHSSLAARRGLTS